MSNNQSSFDQRTDFNPQSVTAAEQLNDYFLQAPVAIAVVTRDDYRFAVANNKYLHTIGRRREEIINRPAFEVMPELKDQLKHLLDQVIESGKGFQATEYKIENYVNGILQTDYYSFSYEPIRGRDGIINAIFISGYNVTEQVQTKVSLQQSETQLRLVADALPVLISYVDKDERYQFNNKWYEHWFGESRDRVKGQTMRQLLGDKAYEAIQPYVKRALSGERFSYESKVHYRKHGETYIHATYIPDISNNEVRGFYALVEDVTKRRLADDKIRESELHFRRMADTVPSIIWVTDKDGYCTYLNKHWYECTGQTEQEALGFGWLKATHPEDAPATEITFLDANTKQVEFNSTYRLRFADGKYRWVIDRGKPRYDAFGDFEGFTGSVTDIHLEKEAEEKIRVSEAKYRNLFNTMDQGFCIVDLIFDNNGKPIDYRFLEANPMFANQTGLENALGRTAKELLPDLEQSWIDIYGNVATTGESVRFSQGSEVMKRWFDVYAFKLGGSESRQVAILFTDVSERKKSEQQILESEGRFRALVTATSDVIYRITPDWKVMQNLQGQGILNQSGEPINDWLEKYFHPEEHQRVRKAIEEAIETKSVFEMEHQVLRQDGTTGWTFSRAIPVLDAHGNISEWFGAASDITEQKLSAQALQESENRYRTLASQLEKLVNERTRELQRSNEDLQQFAHVASHDLKEPVRKVKTFVDLLSLQFSNVLPEKGREYLKKIDRSCDRMNTMIEGVLKHSSLSAIESSNEQVNLQDVIEIIESDLEIVIHKKKAVIVKENLVAVTGSSILLYQLFYNLINNSLKFTNKGTDPEIKVVCSTPSEKDISRAGLDEQSSYVKVSVQDNGIGFDSAHAEHIFNTFTRLHAKDQYEGTGLGLALCRTIALKHRGAIWAEGEVGKGAVFNVLLPS